MRNLKNALSAVVDLNTVIMIGIAFAGMMVLGYIIWKIKDQLIPSGQYSLALTDAGNTSRAAWNASWKDANSSMANITGGFDNAINLILVAITIFILAIAISALLMLRGRQQ